MSLPECIGTLAPVLCATKTVSTSGHWETASSTVFFRAILLPPLIPSSAVIKTFAPAENDEIHILILFVTEA